MADGMTATPHWTAEALAKEDADDAAGLRRTEERWRTRGRSDRAKNVADMAAHLEARAALLRERDTLAAAVSHVTSLWPDSPAALFLRTVTSPPGAITPAVEQWAATAIARGEHVTTPPEPRT